MRIKWLKTTMVIGLILTTTSLALVRAAELEEEENVLVEPEMVPEHLRRFETRPEHIERLLAQIREKNPQKADDLIKLKKENPAAFKKELRKAARELFMDKSREDGAEPNKSQQQGRQGLRQGRQTGMGRGWLEMRREWMREKNEEYIKWLKENFPEEATKLEQLKEQNPEQSMRATRISWKKYGKIYLASQKNPELLTVLKELMSLKKERGRLLKEIKTATDENLKKTLTSKLEQVVDNQFDLIVRRKEITYESMSKKLTELQKEVEQKKAEVEKWKNKDFKSNQVKQRVSELISEKDKFEWE